MLPHDPIPFPHSLRAHLPQQAPAGGWVVRRRLALAGAAAVALVTAWAGAATWYILCGDTIAARLLAQQAEMQRDYEERLGQFRARLDRTASQKLLEHEALEKKVVEMAGRQAQLESRQSQISVLADEADPIGARRAARFPEVPAAASAFAPVSPKPKPADEPLGLRLRESSLSLDGGKGAPAALGLSSRIEDRLSALGRSLAGLESTQLRRLDEALRTAQGRLSFLHAAVAETGLHPDGLEVEKPPPGLGGPLMPAAGDAVPGSFDALAHRLRASLSALDRMRRIAAALPFGRPIGAEADLTSGFGYRLDPFTRGPALHTGLDFRGDHGAAVRATGAGRVTTAEPSGGYGNLVEVDHGHGVTTRYAHLSTIAVGVGEAVSAGTVLGRVGSTGRSTGPHLHYETRLHGEAVDPQRFLRAGSRLAAADRRGGAQLAARAD